MPDTHTPADSSSGEIKAPGNRRLGHSVAWPILAGALVGLIIRLVFSRGPGEPYSAMLGSFIYGAPAVSAAVSTWLIGAGRRQSLGTCVVVGGLSASAVVLGALMVFIEGWICALVIFPMFFVVGCITGLLMWGLYRVAGLLVSRSVAHCFVALPLVLGFVEPQLATPPRELYETQQTAFIKAKPEVVWAQVMQTRPMAAGDFRFGRAALLGVPAPVEARTTQGPDGQWVRDMRWEKGVHFYGDVTDLQPNKRIAWRYRFVSDSFPAGALDEHVTLSGEYFALLDGNYTLVEKDGGTVLTETTHWRVSTAFNFYARFLGKWLIADTVGRLVDIIKIRSEI